MEVFALQLPRCRLLEISLFDTNSTSPNQIFNEAIHHRVLTSQHSYIQKVMSNVFRHIAMPWLAMLVALVMLLVVNLSGSTSSLSFLQELYFSKVVITTEYFWTMYNFCSKSSSGQVTCTPNFAAYPYAPYVLNKQIGNDRVFYYGLRAAYGLLVAAIAFTLIANALAMVSLCWRLRKPYSWFRSSVWLAYLTAAIGAALVTALHTSGRNSFRSLGYSSSLGIRMMIFLWIGVGLLFVACLLLSCLAEPIFAQTHKNGRYDTATSNLEMYYVPPMQMPNSYQQYPQTYPQLNGYQPQPQPLHGYQSQPIQGQQHYQHY